MITKLAYVLTCSPEKSYIEQALMAVFSARHWNPDVHIVLLTDNKTNELLVGERGEILHYIDEKIVIPFDDGKSMMYRSRYIKTQVRELIKGDFLFVDCDTITCKSLGDIDNWDIEAGAVYESHLPVSEFCESLFQSADDANRKIGVDISKEKEYFSSGVIYVKDTPSTYKLYKLWHKYWLESQESGVPIDQPSLCKANIECGHLIKKIPDTYNTILFTQCDFTRDAYILHIAAYRNPSYLFKDTVFAYIKQYGLSNDLLKELILNPCYSFFPFDINILYYSFNNLIKESKIYSLFLKGYSQISKGEYSDIQKPYYLKALAEFLYKYKAFVIYTFLWLSTAKIHSIKHKKNITNNICRK